jgi:molecular chaperone Hsp33
MADQLIRATGESLPIRLVICDFTEIAQIVARQHQAQAWSMSLLADAMIASSFLSASMKHAGSVSFEARFSGDISSVHADTSPMGLVRATISSDECQKLKEFEPALSPQLLTIKKFSEKGKKLSEGIIEMPTQKIGPSLATYFLQSEQVKSAVYIESKWNEKDTTQLEFAYGFYIEAFPDITDLQMTFIEYQVRDIKSMVEFKTENGLDAKKLLTQICGDYPWTIHREILPTLYCPCSIERIEKSLVSLGIEGIQEIIDDGEAIEMVCEYCKEKYNIDLAHLEKLRSELL